MDRITLGLIILSTIAIVVNLIPYFISTLTPKNKKNKKSC
jgi:hypothetical protein